MEPSIVEHESAARIAAGTKPEQDVEQRGLPARQVVEGLHLLGHRAPFAELLHLDPSADAALLRAAVAELQSLLLVDGDEAELVLVRPAERYLPNPLGFGRPVIEASPVTACSTRSAT